MDVSLLVVIAVVYFVFCSRTFYWDGVSFALVIEEVYRGQSPFVVLFHPNHLLYNVFGYVLYAGARHLSISVRAITLLQYSDLVFSVACGYLVLHIARRLSSSPLIPYVCWLLFSFGALWWHFSTDADAYIFATLLLTISFVCLLPSRLRFLALTGLFHALAMLCHELSVFFYVPVVAAILQNRHFSFRRRLTVSSVYIAVTAAVAASVYVICYSMAKRTTTLDFLQWITSRSEDAHFRFSFITLLGSNLGSYVKLFVGGKFSFLKQYASAPVVTALLVSFLAITYFVFLSWKSRQERLAAGFADVHTKQHQLRNTLFAWFVAYALFLSVWLPWNGFYKLFLWPPLVLLLGCTIDKRQTGQAPYHWLPLIVALAAWNFAAYIFPHSHASADPVLALAERIDKELPHRATIYYRQFVTDDWYLRYFAPGREWSLLPDLQTVQASSLLSPSSTVCFETSALSVIRTQNNSDHGRLLSLLHKSGFHWSLVSSKYDVELACTQPSGE